ncbi:flagellar basal body L-ring protein FlgH [Tranquillimonas alkanivorans]|uniref:Flagellar L-ring protein n=1 Tax=Tranquillimonas alkanivorans TaxID=441119 RepID=A0A1I5S594_9RHOB|nr:flagellar basal body L-ring protein FlgH [Tranquillimonas alkanivorans]SFP65882.1 flagellar L-ring protein precursor FlgH [Tranquillimonas alkanivorans]
MRRTPLVPLGLAVTLAACGTPSPFDRDPEVSSLVVDETTIPEARVRVPMPEPEPPRLPYRAERASLWERDSAGFFADQRATDVGDILTIIISIEDEAQLRNASSREREGASQLPLPNFFGYGTQIDRILPGVGPEDLPTGDLVDLSSSTAVNGTGSINRFETINLKVAALVVQELPNGNLVVAGRQEVKVNQELRELRVAGIIRPQDIQTNNTIPYEKIAEARIAYGGRGELSRAQQRSYGEDVMDIILPY